MRIYFYLALFRHTVFYAQTCGWGQPKDEFIPGTRLLIAIVMAS